MAQLKCRCSGIFQGGRFGVQEITLDEAVPPAVLKYAGKRFSLVGSEWQASGVIHLYEEMGRAAQFMGDD